MGPDGRAGITADLVRRLLTAQVPRWADLPIRPVAVDGWDNRTYRLGEDLSVRLPTAAAYAPGVEKEHRWLPVLAPHLPMAVPEPLVLGEPTDEFPRPWSVRRWLPGETARADRVTDLPAFARQVAGFLRDLQRVDATGGPQAGPHCFHRGGPLRHYDEETRQALSRLAGRVDSRRATEVWGEALASTWPHPPVWFHGDVASGNLLVREGRLSAVIDFGTCGVGDPACDLVLAWTLLSGESRRAFRDAVGHDETTWARARGWALWKALITEDLELVEALLDS